MKGPRTKFLLVLISLLGIMGCDPVYQGKAIIRNETNYAMEFKYRIDTASLYSSSNTFIDVVVQVPPDTFIVFTDFNGRGNAKYFKCCTCEFDSLLIRSLDTTKSINKDIQTESNWKIFNPNKSFGSKDVECEFRITQDDLQ